MFRRLAAWWLLGLALVLAGCGKSPEPAPQAAAKADAPAGPQGAFTVLAGSELKDVAPALEQAATAAGVPLKLSYAGTLEMVERINAGEQYDAILPPNGAYPALALANKPLAREKLFYSRVALGVKAPVLQKLGWDKAPPTWADIARAAAQGRLRYGMTNPASSNTGMSALFAVASAVAGKTEDLDAREVNAKVLKDFLSGQKLTAGSSGWRRRCAGQLRGCDPAPEREAARRRPAHPGLPARRRDLGRLSADAAQRCAARRL